MREEGKLALSPWFPSRCLAKSFVLRRCSNLFFPAPISCLGVGYLPDAVESREVARLKPCPSFGVLVRTVLQFGFAVQSSGKKRCGRRVGELRKWVSACHEPTGSPACERLSLCGVCFPTKPDDAALVNFAASRFFDALRFYGKIATSRMSATYSGVWEILWFEFENAPEDGWASLR